ncbi:juvenile hormone acid O-methyltransferase-like [Rhodnius prolixus]|uniref:juvenile hormone acid O-methyltransferase-like n=1 Tax=Rhodnius prolixus TaxID=13249 RepID=UPI003D18B535
MNAKFYSLHNEMQTNDAKCVLKEMVNTFHWTDFEYILDVGSGPGDVTFNVIRPLIGISSYIVGSDISDDLVKFANARYSSDNLKFKKLDIESYDIWDNWKKESFDKIFSFYCLHWIQNIRQATVNIYNLLKPGGDILLVMLAKNPLYLLFKIMSRLHTWSAYLKDVENLRSPFQTSMSAVQDFTRILESVQFTEVSVVNKECKFTFSSTDSMLNAIQAVTPFLDKIPNNLHARFIEDLQNCIPQCSFTNVKEDGSWEVRYTLIVAKASKMNNH